MADSEQVDLETLGAEAELVSLGTAVAQVLEKLNEVTAQQQRGILELVLSAAERARLPVPEAIPEVKAVSHPAAEPEAAEAEQPDAAVASEAKEGMSPEEVRARALATVYEAAAQALGVAFQNAVNAQQQLNVLGQAALAGAAATLLEAGVKDEAQPSAGVLKAG
ncbi:MAG TPA: RebB family R body protein [Myxococcaceae bacterium]|nr:RebB family R body protein [Myxococcaceae bacterium]